MFAKNLMLPRTNLITVSPKDTIKKALEVIEENHFLSVPVAEGDKFYGSISKERIYTFYFEKCDNKECFFSDFLVETVMRKDVPSINPEEQAEKAVDYLATRKLAFVAVIDDYNRFTGIITHNAVFKEFTDLFGLNKGKRLAVTAYDVPGQISKLSKIITENGGDIISFVIVDPKSVIDVKEIVVRLSTDNYDEIVKKVKEAGYKIQ